MGGLGAALVRAGRCSGTLLFEALGCRSEVTVGFVDELVLSPLGERARGLRMPR